MTATYQDVAQMIRDGVSAEEIEAVLADERTALTDEQIEGLRDDLAVRDEEGLTEGPEIEGCESGEATGELCQSVLGPDVVVIEWMPEYLRESHRAAGNSGSYPGNGAIRFRACPECAASLTQHDGEWTRVVD